MTPDRQTAALAPGMQDNTYVYVCVYDERDGKGKRERKKKRKKKRNGCQVCLSGWSTDPGPGPGPWVSLGLWGVWGLGSGSWVLGPAWTAGLLDWVGLGWLSTNRGLSKDLCTWVLYYSLVSEVTDWPLTGQGIKAHTKKRTGIQTDRQRSTKQGTDRGVQQGSGERRTESGEQRAANQSGRATGD